MGWLRAYWTALRPLTPASLMIGLGLPALFIASVADQLVTHLRQVRRRGADAPAKRS